MFARGAHHIGANTTFRVRGVPDVRGIDGCETRNVKSAAGEPRVSSLATATGLASSLIVVGGLVVVVICDVALARGGRSELRLLAGGGPAFVLGALSATAVGVVLLRSRPAHPVGWCFAALGATVMLTGAAQVYGSWALFVDGDAPLGVATAMVSSTGFIVWEVLLGLVCALTPDGRALTRRWGWAARGLIGAGLLWLLAAVLTPGPLQQEPFTEVNNPWGVEVSGLKVAGNAGAAGTSLFFVACAVSLFVRFRRSRGDDRRRLLWMATGVAPVPVFVVIMFAAARSGALVVLDLTAGSLVALLPVSAALSITKYHLYDVERVLSRTVTYVLLSLSLAAAYAAVVVVVGEGLGGVAGSSTVSVAAATLVVAVAARPLHGVLQDVVDRRFVRRRYDALRTIRAHVAHPQTGSEIEQVLRDALQDPTLSVAYWVADRDHWATADGRDTTPGQDALIVERAGRVIAAVTAAPASDLLANIVKEAEPVIESSGLRAAVALQLQEVRASRTRIATAQLQERRRIERDLHDGAQQRLLALAAQLQAALLNGEPARQQEALRIGVEQSRQAVAELRSLANGLHPAVLTEGGLGAALDDLANRLPVRVHMDDANRRSPLAIEATAWFVACEAVTNAVKHAHASSVRVDVAAVAQNLVLRVGDNGCGGADPSGPGLSGLADRVEAVGGQLRVSEADGGGTLVEAVLPCEW